MSEKLPIQKKNLKEEKPIPIVAIGASAGGLDAITQILESLSPTTGNGLCLYTAFIADL